jgi:cytidylate kinase
MSTPRINIAIDGKSACGKSTLARALARSLGYLYVDSGAMYRAVTLFFLKNQIRPDDESAVIRALDDIQIRFQRISDHQWTTLLNQEDVEEALRSQEVSDWVSEVAAVSAVRRKMVEEQQSIGQSKGVVMDGRDIGTVVFPDAELKIFLTAREGVRVERRYHELLLKGKSPDREKVRANLEKRDYIDSTRSDSPLIQAADAVVLDNSDLTEQEQLTIALEWAMERIKNTATHG